ncbi:MerR family transcriptional regulator [Pontivivens insulae]|uniref:HTH-type transcriptional regulator ZntR n=1 Tax=Pontivivens insulae TaxID=1639689 RepID=A0A2R8AA68_9RHOB|nr:MerR family DNA-binding transcriptional regulator [Pontivivens insulae]RED13035.1 MerR family transcriptional regulator [Pontivivens insulae]SPF29127.1 HTH-type transcriptional regulator ZntR [Pontivivens insulae]
MSEEKQTLQEMCEAYDVTPRTLRYYEYIELLSPERDGRKRLYGQKERARLTLILRGRRFGFSLEEIRQWLELYDVEDNQTTQFSKWIELSTNQIDELEARKAELDEAIAELKRLREVAEQALGGNS